MKRLAFVMFAVSAVLLFAGCASTGVGAGPQIDAAALALADAQNEGADNLCPQEFQSAELKLKQAQLLMADDEDEQAGLVAEQTMSLAELAKKCAIAAKSQSGQAPVNVGPPAELKDFKATIFFDYNSNVIEAGSRKVLDQTIVLLNKYSQQHKFYVLVSAFADPPGSVEDNLELARRRALVTRFYLAQQNVPRGRIYMEALGKSPAMRAKGATARGRDPEWRKVEVTVLFERPKAVMTSTLLNQ
jgi:outer membrane protein OmpA-like peptidoglycan-associated protein